MERQLTTGWGRFKTQMNMLFVDHGFLRIPYYTRVALSDDMVRTNQPLPIQLEREAACGLKTVVNLRGENAYGSYYLEEEACDKLGLELINFRVKSRDMPAKDVLHGARDLFQRIEYPALMHCKSGADRVGLMSTLYLFVHKGESLERALRQLNWLYGHVAVGKTGILDYFFQQYQEYNAATPIGFYDWVDTVYEPQALKEAFHASWLGNVVVDKVLRRE